MSFKDLRVYQAAENLRVEVDQLGRKVHPRCLNAYRHLNEAADSIMNNIAEGSASTYPARQKTFYDIARGSAREAQSSLRSLDQRNAFGGANVFRSIVLTQVITKMLTQMILKIEAKQKQ